jgi:hypothetical protein
MKNPITPEHAASAQSPLPPVPTTKILAISQFIGTPVMRAHGCPDHAAGAPRVVRRDLRDQAIEAIAPTIKTLRAQGFGYHQIPLVLNDDGYLTATGRARNATNCRATA